MAFRDPVAIAPCSVSLATVSLATDSLATVPLLLFPLLLILSRVVVCSIPGSPFFSKYAFYLIFHF
jgi:hypothetical protein